jgi:hypothetical protein
MTLASGGAFGPTAVTYDPLMRFAQTGGTRFLRFADETIGEYHAGALVLRIVPGPGLDEPAITQGPTGSRQWPVADERGSVVARTRADGTASAVNR